MFHLGGERVAIPRGQLGNLKEKFFDDIEQKKGNIQRTAVDIPERHGMQVSDRRYPEKPRNILHACL